MGCELVGITPNGVSVRFEIEQITKVTQHVTEVLLYPSEGSGCAVITRTIKPAPPSERNDSVEILQAVMMLPRLVAFDPHDGQGVKLYLRRDDVVHAIIEAGRR